jgi:hypothetical protein
VTSLPPLPAGLSAHAVAGARDNRLVLADGPNRGTSAGSLRGRPTAPKFIRGPPEHPYLRAPEPDACRSDAEQIDGYLCGEKPPW